MFGTVVVWGEKDLPPPRPDKFHEDWLELGRHHLRGILPESFLFDLKLRSDRNRDFRE
jgi:hypothetical protein